MSKIYARFSSRLVRRPVPLFYFDASCLRNNRFGGKWIKLFSVASFIVLSGCSTYSETFDCPPGSGVGCKSISEVDQMIDDGKLAEEKPKQGLPINLAGYKVFPQHEPTVSLASHGPADGSVSRRPERYLRVWTAAFEDRSGNLFSESFVYTVFKPGEWRVDEGIGS